MKLFGFEIRKCKSKIELEKECREVYDKNMSKTFYEWQKDIRVVFGEKRSIPWIVCGRSGRWILIGSDSTYARGCIKHVNFSALDGVCDASPYRCYRFVRPGKLGKELGCK